MCFKMVSFSFSLPEAQQTFFFFSSWYSLWELDRILGGESHKMWSPLLSLVAGPTDIFITQTCPCGASSNPSVTVQVFLPWLVPEDVSVCGFLFCKLGFIVSAYWSLQVWRQQFSLRPQVSDGCKKSCWFFFFFHLFSFSTVRTECLHQGSYKLD